ncbi:hypothetical protein CANCADRAFT_30304 [Tortispora caseinolytica NRRL Y-17796]|uniref:ATPase expression protein 2, mitochondrial n=1 Tax=Tortispora caseinolytica NRRL Y-17796 TaxID=767744 RepID=A0A1E4TJX6_9ASCO|nr:hypothetical protein CANCADRAFT_30304 [Tortispora caseinolytica NRRL Y-17796]
MPPGPASSVTSVAYIIRQRHSSFTQQYRHLSPSNLLNSQKPRETHVHTRLQTDSTASASSILRSLPHPGLGTLNSFYANSSLYARANTPAFLLDALEPSSNISIQEHEVPHASDALVNGVQAALYGESDDVICGAPYLDAWGLFDPQSISTTEPILRPLVDAIAARDDTAAYNAYIALCKSGNDSKITHRLYSMLLLSIRPRGESKSCSHGTRPVCMLRLEHVERDMYKHGYKVDAMEYSHMLWAARNCGDIPDNVHGLWERIQSHSVPLDVWMWNMYIAAYCSGAPMQWQIRFQLSDFVESGSVEAADKSTSRKSSPLTDKYASTAGDRAIAILNQMLDAGYHPDATTYSYVALALARSNRPEEIEGLVTSVWGVTPDGPIESSKLVPYGSMLRPNGATLEALANALGASDRVFSAIAIVSRMAEAYRIDLRRTQRVWKALLRWSYHTAKPSGNTPRTVTFAIWKLIERYHVPTDQEMFEYVLKSERRVGHCDNLESLAKKLYYKSDIAGHLTLVDWALKFCVLKLVRLGRIEKALDISNNWVRLNPALYQPVKDRVERFIEEGNWVVKQQQRQERLKQIHAAIENGRDPFNESGAVTSNHRKEDQEVVEELIQKYFPESRPNSPMSSSGSISADSA